MKEEKRSLVEKLDLEYLKNQNKSLVALVSQLKARLADSRAQQTLHSSPNYALAFLQTFIAQLKIVEIQSCDWLIKF